MAIQNQNFERISFFDAISSNKTKTIALIVLIFLLFLAMVFAMSMLFDLGSFGIFVGFIVLFFYTGISYFAGDKIVLAMSNAKKISANDQPVLFSIVEGLSAAASIPMPEIYVIEDQSPNAFAVGRDPQHAAIGVTRGLLQNMDQNELTAVLAHEISHIANYDIRFMLIAIVFAGSIALLADIMWRSVRYGGGRSRKGGGFIVIIAIVLVVIAPIFSELIRFAISRQREYLADANGARMTRQPQYLASALQKIAKINLPVAAATDATAPLYFSRPLSNKFYHLFSTHPQIEERIARLRAMH